MNRKTSDVELGGQFGEAAARWLNFVPSGHRHDTTGSAQSALETLEEHTRSCREHPVRALWVAHRHLQDPSPAIRIASLALASEALWWLGHFARKHLDLLLQSAGRFAPAWALRGQVKVWLAPDNPDAAQTDFEAAAKFDSAKWVVPHRISDSAFRAKVNSEIAKFDSEMGRTSNNPVGIELLPAESVAAGKDPDVRWELISGPDTAPTNPLAVLGSTMPRLRTPQRTRTATHL